MWQYSDKEEKISLQMVLLSGPRLQKGVILGNRTSYCLLVRVRAHTHTHTPMETMWMNVQFLANLEDRQAKKKKNCPVNYNHSVH